MPTEQR